MKSNEIFISRGSDARRLWSPDHDGMNMFIYESEQRHRRPHTGVTS